VGDPITGDVLTGDTTVAGKAKWAPPIQRARVFVFTSPATPAAGDQSPELYADRALELDYVQASGASRVAVVVVDVKKNGTSVFPTTTKLDAPSAGGLGTRRVPDTVNVAEGDRLTVVFTSADFTDPDKILVYIGGH
jgi:hypothetical protein